MLDSFHRLIQTKKGKFFYFTGKEDKVWDRERFRKPKNESGNIQKTIPQKIN
jgi:hypothetical protein